MDDYNDFGGADLTAGFGAFIAFFILLFGILLLITLAIYVYTSIAYQTMYKKSGHPNPWGAWVPFYRDYLFFEHGGVSGWLYIIAYGAAYLLTGIAGVVMTLGQINAAETYMTYGDFSEASMGSIVIGQIFNVLANVPLLAVFVLQIFVVININRAYSLPGGGMIALGILVPIVWIGILAWSKTSLWRPEMAIHGTRGIFVPRQGKTFLERQIAARFGGQMPMHAQKQPKPNPQAPAYTQAQPYTGQPAAQQPHVGQQQVPANPAQPQAPAQPQPQPQPQAPVYPSPDQAQAPAYPEQPQTPTGPEQPQAPAPAEGDTESK
jgi:hypothetical protein